MQPKRFRVGSLALWLAIACAVPAAALAEGDLHKVNHVIVVMQENHSFDNYFGALAYAPNSPYRAGAHGCEEHDHKCVDGLSCRFDSTGELRCANSNLDDDGSRVKAFHDPSRCVVPDLNHSWFPVHQEANFDEPNATLVDTRSDGFVRVNDATEQTDNGVETPTDDETMGFYTQDDIPFYYDLAAKFAIGDRFSPPFSARLSPIAPTSWRRPRSAI